MAVVTDRDQEAPSHGKARGGSAPPKGTRRSCWPPQMVLKPGASLPLLCWESAA